MRIIYMNNYKITRYTYNKAKELGLSVEVSKFPLKKLDVYKDNIYIASIGDSRYNDYPHYCIIYNKEYGDKRKLLYRESPIFPKNILFLYTSNFFNGFLLTFIVKFNSLALSKLYFVIT